MSETNKTLLSEIMAGGLPDKVRGNLERAEHIRRLFESELLSKKEARWLLGIEDEKPVESTPEPKPVKVQSWTEREEAMAASLADSHSVTQLKAKAFDILRLAMIHERGAVQVEAAKAVLSCELTEAVTEAIDAKSS